MTSKLKQQPFEKRREAADKILKKYIDRIPVRIDTKNKDLTFEKSNYICPLDMSFGHLIHEIRKHITSPISAETGLYFLTDKGTIPSTGSKLAEIYQQYKNEDGFLYLTCCKENVFGF